MELKGICSLCGKLGKMHTCQLCGSMVCTSCYNSQKGICKSCKSPNTHDIRSFK